MQLFSRFLGLWILSSGLALGAQAIFFQGGGAAPGNQVLAGVKTATSGSGQSKALTRHAALNSAPADAPWNADAVGFCACGVPITEGLPCEPTLGENVATGWVNNTAVSSTLIQQEIDINKVVSYATNSDGTLPAYVYSGSNSPVSANARVTIFINIQYTDPDDIGSVVQVYFPNLNNNNLGPLVIPFVLGYDAFPSVQTIVPISCLKFGQTKIDPLVTTAEQISASPSSFSPTPGQNFLQFYFVSNPDRGTPLQGGYIANIYSFIEYDAVAPILMVHGTAANATTWLAPPAGTTLLQDMSYLGMTSVGWPLTPFVATSGYASSGGFFEYQQQDGSYPGIWFHNFNLGSRSPGGQGNAGIDADGNELMLDLSAILQAFGSRSCHLIAHSKGGSDCRSMIAQMAAYGLLENAGSNIEYLNLSAYKILSLYTIGTPHLGTPLADIVADVASAGSSSFFIQSNNSAVTAVANATALAMSIPGTGVGLTPATMDQRVNVRQQQYNSDQTLNWTNNHFYSIIGEADVNGNNDKNAINAAEKIVLYPGLLPAARQVAYMYNVVGNSAQISATLTPDNSTSYNSYVPQTYNYILTLVPGTHGAIVEPNDTVCPLWSGIGPHAQPFVVDAGGIIQTNWVNSGKLGRIGQVSSIGKNYVNILSFGNHSLIKNGDCAVQIFTQIINDYPLQSFSLEN